MSLLGLLKALKYLFLVQLILLVGTSVNGQNWMDELPDSSGRIYCPPSILIPDSLVAKYKIKSMTFSEVNPLSLNQKKELVFFQSFNEKGQLTTQKGSQFSLEEGLGLKVDFRIYYLEKKPKQIDYYAIHHISGTENVYDSFIFQFNDKGKITAYEKYSANLWQEQRIDTNLYFGKYYYSPDGVANIVHQNPDKKNIYRVEYDYLNHLLRSKSKIDNGQTPFYEERYYYYPDQKLKSMDYWISSQRNLKKVYAYNEKGKLKSIADLDATDSMITLKTFIYNKQGQIKEIFIEPHGQNSSELGTLFQYKLDNQGRLIELTKKEGKQVKMDYKISYDDKYPLLPIQFDMMENKEIIRSYRAEYKGY